MTTPINMQTDRSKAWSPFELLYRPKHMIEKDEDKKDEVKLLKGSQK